MAFSDLIAGVDAICLGTFGAPATLHPSAGGSIPFTGIIEPPALEEAQGQPIGSYDIANIETKSEGGATLKLRSKGGAPGIRVIRFFVHLQSISPAPSEGDVVSFP